MNWATIENTVLWKNLTFTSKENLKHRWEKLTTAKRKQVFEIFKTSQEDNDIFLKIALKELEQKKKVYKKDIRILSEKEEVMHSKVFLDKLLDDIK